MNQMFVISKNHCHTTECNNDDFIMIILYVYKTHIKDICNFLSKIILKHLQNFKHGNIKKIEICFIFIYSSTLKNVQETSDDHLFVVVTWPSKIVFVLSMLPSWNKIINQSQCHVFWQRPPMSNQHSPSPYNLITKLQIVLKRQCVHHKASSFIECPENLDWCIIWH